MFKILKGLADAAVDKYNEHQEKVKAEEAQKERERLAEIAYLEKQLAPDKYRVDQAISKYTSSHTFEKSTLEEGFDSLAGKIFDDKVVYDRLKQQFDEIQVTYNAVSEEINIAYKELEDLSKRVKENIEELRKVITTYYLLHSFLLQHVYDLQ